MDFFLHLFNRFSSVLTIVLCKIYLLSGEIFFKFIDFMRDNYELIFDIIIHLIRLNFQYAFIYSYIGLFWLYFLRDQIRWPTFFPYALFLVLFKRFFFTPFLIFMLGSLDFWSGLFCYNIFMLYFLFFCIALFDYAQIWEKSFERKNLQVTIIEDTVITKGMHRYRYSLICFPFFMIIVSFYYYLKPFPLHIFSF